MLLNHFPSTLPTCTIAEEDLRPHYSLASIAPHLVEQHLLRHQLTQLHLWCTQPVETTRPRNAIQEATWEDVRSSILLYLGYCHLHTSAKVGLHQHCVAWPHLCTSWAETRPVVCAGAQP